VGTSKGNRNNGSRPGGDNPAKLRQLKGKGASKRGETKSRVKKRTQRGTRRRGPKNTKKPKSPKNGPSHKGNQTRPAQGLCNADRNFIPLNGDAHGVAKIAKGRKACMCQEKKRKSLKGRMQI